RRRRLIGHIHDFHHGPQDGAGVDIGGRLRAIAARLSENGADMILVPSQDRAAFLTRRGSKKAFVVPNAPLRHVFADITPTPMPWTVVRHGVLGPGHGLETLVQSLGLWPDEIGLLLFGQSTSEQVA